MACGGQLASVDDFEKFFCIDVEDGSAEETALQQALDLAASDVYMALQASSQCDCTWSVWSTEYLKKLNVVDMAVFYNCPCKRVKFVDSMRETFMTWVNDELAAIRSGEVDVCQGATGKNFPAGAYASHAWTEWQAAKLLDELTPG